jgi:hypothetical protein
MADSLRPSYEGRVFVTKANTANGEVDSSTRFQYHQSEDGAIVWAEYSGGSVIRGFLIATVQVNGVLDARYEHVNVDGVLKTGMCTTSPEQLPDGRLRLHEHWQWTSGDMSTGNSMVEEEVAT